MRFRDIDKDNKSRESKRELDTIENVIPYGRLLEKLNKNRRVRGKRDEKFPWQL